jgi:hypothetical protein
MRFLILALFLVACGSGTKENVKGSALAISNHAGSIKGSALSSIEIAKRVSIDHPKTKPQMDKIISLQDEIIKRSVLISEQAIYIDKQIEDIDEMIDWFKLIFLLGMGFGGIIIGYLSFKVGKWKTTVFGAVMCFGAVSMNFYWHLIETAFLPIVGGVFAIILCFMYVHFIDEKRRVSNEPRTSTLD